MKIDNKNPVRVSGEVITTIPNELGANALYSTAPILLVDLEATCSDDDSISAEQMETIEIGACWVGSDGTVFERFQSFVRPVANPKLTSFCTNLTGIQQGNVDGAPLFPVAAASLSQFVE